MVVSQTILMVVAIVLIETENGLIARENGTALKLDGIDAKIAESETENGAM